MGECKINGCKKTAEGLGFCCMHYTRFKKYGSPYIVKKMPNGTNASKHPLYNSWRGIMDRCNTPSNKWYPNYGGRGIKVCQRWLPPNGFWNFVEDMGDRPSHEKYKNGRYAYSLDRIDVNGDYCPENCRWANQSQQMNNTRKNKKYTINGISGTFTELFRLLAPKGLKKKTAEARIYDHNWSAERAILTPVKGSMKGDAL